MVKMKDKIKNIIKGYKFIYQTIKIMRKIRSKYKKGISGKNNVIINKGFLYKVKYDIVGDNNLIEITQGSELSNITIYIRGNTHIFEVGGNCSLKGGTVWFEDDSGLIKIGNNTIIGTGSVVTKDIPANSIAAGTPAKIIRSNINWLRERIY